MTGSLELADHFARMVLSVLVIIFYCLGLIRGASAIVLVILAVLVISTFAVKVILKWMTMD